MYDYVAILGVHFIRVTCASRNGVCRRLFQRNVDALHSFIRQLRCVLVTGLLHCQAERKHSITHVVIQFRNNSRP